MAVLPTGWGKSLLYQVPALLLSQPVLVVSPLIALMRDQEAALRRRGVPVVRLDSTLKVSTRRQSLARIAKGGRLIVLTTPETLESEGARPAIEAARPALLCVDEAHCITEWGHDFRPAYLRLGAERRALSIPTALALTATATPRVQEHIAERLALDDPLVVLAPPHRKNLRLSVEEAPGNLKLEVAGRLIRKLARPGIVYCSTTRAVDEIFGALTRARIPAARYHGKMKTSDRTAAQRRFMKSGRKILMVATNAFGMGVDKPDIRSIVHYQLPGSLEQYVQEAGRAGRDGKPSRCILLFDEDDLDIQAYLQEQGRPSGSQLRRVAATLAAWSTEQRAVSTKDLAASAGVGRTTAASLCAQLEGAGLLELDAKRRWHVRVGVRTLTDSATDLSKRFETIRRQDAARLRAVGGYALTEACRSVFIRRWFGEAQPPECGKCDRCQAKRHLARTLARARERAGGRS